MLIKVLFVVTVYLANDVQSSKDIMQEISINFKRPLEACRKEMDYPESVVTDFYNFWKEGYQLTDRHTGCAILCMASKLDLLDQTLHLHHGKAGQFARTHGADEVMEKQLLDLIKKCERDGPPTDDDCEMIVNLAQCFKAGIHELDWAPSMDVIVGELLAEVKK